MEIPFCQNSVIPLPESILPPEMLLLILHRARISDIKNCRLVSSCWNQYGIQVLRRIHPVIQFSSSDRVKEFMAAMPIGPLPFSGFNFARYPKPQHVLRFLDRYGSSLRKLDIEVIDFVSFTQRLSSPVVPGVEVKAIQRISGLAFLPTLKLESLKLPLFTATLPSTEALLLACPRHLKKLELLVTTHVGQAEVERFIKELFRISPALQELVIGNGAEKYFHPEGNSTFLARLPAWLKEIPKGIRIGLRLGEVNDKALPLLLSLVLEPMNVVTLFLLSVNFEDATVSTLFCKWLFQQPLEEIELGDGLNWKHLNEENIFKKCTKLTLNHNYVYREASCRRMLACFPNVTHVSLFIKNQECLVMLGTMLPCLEHLTSKGVQLDFWGIFAGLSITKVCELFAGLGVTQRPDDSPVKEALKTLKYLDLEITYAKHLLPILYCTRQGIIPRLKKLTITKNLKRADADTRRSIKEYGQALTAYHDSILLKSTGKPELSFYIDGKVG